MKRQYLVLLLILLTQALQADSLRGPFKGELLPEAPAISLNLEDILFLPQPSASPFYTGLEIEVQIPRELLTYRLAFAVYLYQDIQPLGQKQLIEAKAKRLLLAPFPPSAKFFFQIPLGAGSGLRSTVDTVVLKSPIAAGSWPLALSVLPIDKGLPPEAQKAVFSIKTRMIKADIGAVNLVFPGLTPEQKESLLITADKKVFKGPGPYFLTPGLQELTLQGPGLGPLTVKAMVTPGQTTDISVSFEEPKVELSFEAPAGTIITLDGKKLETWSPLEPLTVTKGPHTIQFVLGDYQITKTIELVKPGKHRISLLLDILLESN